MKTLASFSPAIIACLGISYALASNPAEKRGISPDFQSRKPAEAAISHPPRSQAPRTLAFADPPAEKKGPPAATKSAQEIIKEACNRLQGYKSVKAKITERVTIQDHSFTAAGSYTQGQNNQVLLELQVSLGGNRGSMLEVCDGQILWVRQDVIDQVRITRRDVQKILQAAEQSGGRVNRTSLVAEMGMGGLSGLLGGIATDMDFSAPTEGEIDTIPAIVLDGKWNQKFLTRFNGGKNAKGPLPAFVPDQVRILLQKDNLFPRRISYAKKTASSVPNTPLMVLDLSNIRLNEQLRPDTFRYNPPATPTPIDETAAYVQAITQAAEAAKAGPGAAPQAPAKQPPKGG
ncbi:MAG: hypothetical protein U0903_00340 [Planctomycetales bacterium]